MEDSKNVQSIVKLSNSISASFSSLKLVAFMSFAIAAVTAVICVWLTVSGANERENQIYILNEKGQVFAATRQSMSVSREDEVRDQLLRFHELFFNVPSNPEIIRSNLDRAFEISDKSTYRYYNDLQESGFYRRMTSTGASQQVVVDSIRVDMSRKPYLSITYATQYILRESNITQYSLVTRCGVMEVQRTPKNLHGLQIEQFDVVENVKRGERRR